MVYCVSDIHGCYDEFIMLLQKINLSQADTLYVLGDAIDRGPDSIKCLQLIKYARNIHMLMGNHELMMLDVLTQSEDCRKHDIDDIWLNYNGGVATYKQFIEQPEEEQAAIRDYLRGLPFYVTLKVRSKKYFLVHAGLNLSERKPREHLSTSIRRQQTEHPNEMVWIRWDFITNPGLPDYIMVFGHTPTRSIPSHRNDTIWHSNRMGTFKPTSRGFHHWGTHKIGIDCGCYNGGNLAALCLDDMREFYVPHVPRKPELDD